MGTRGILIMALVMHLGAAARGETLSPTEGGRVPAGNVQSKKLIRWAAELTNKTLASEVPGKVKVWEESGYDGLCFSISSHASGSTREELLSPANSMFFRWWCLTKRSREEFAPEIEAFKSVEDWGRLTDNFLLTAVRPIAGRPADYFNDSDWGVILHNARLAASIAREVGFRGLVLDTEAYGWAAKGAWSNPWSYGQYASDWYQVCGHETPLSFAEVATKVRKRGKQYAQAISEAFPEIVLLVAPGLYECAWTSCAQTGESLSENSSGLYPAFVDGLVLGLSDEALLVSLSEATYAMSQYRDLVTARDKAKEQALVVSSVPELARHRISFAAGLWTDLAYGITGSFSNTDAQANHRDPKRHEHATSNALAVSDHYAWHYGEASYFLKWGEGYPFDPDFDKEYDEPPALIHAYWRANERAHEPHDLFWVPQPDFDTNDYTEFNTQAAKRNKAFWEGKEKEGFKLIKALPEYWRFLFDFEVLGRSKSYPASLELWGGTSWFSVSSKRCWQSQGIKANGYAWYGTTFEVPVDLDVKTQQVFIAFGAYAPQPVNIYLNDRWIGYLPKNLMPDITDKIKVGEENLLVLGFLNKKGPGGLAGDVKIISRNK